MQGVRLAGNCLAIASLVGTGAVSVYGVALALPQSRTLAWCAVAVCVGWFVSLGLRSLTKARARCDVE